MVWLRLIPIVLVVLSLNFVDNANILAIIPTPCFSHQVAHAEVWNQLSLRGHQVTVLTSHKQNRADLTNLTEIDLRSAEILLEERRNSVDLDKLSPLQCMKKILELFTDVSDHCLEKDDVYDLIHNTNNHQFDVVIVEYLYPEFLAFGEIYDAPTIMIGSMDPPKNIHDLYGNPTHPVIYPSILLPINGELSFPERVLTTLFTIYYDHYRETELYVDRQKLIEKHFKNVSLTINELMKKVSATFINANQFLTAIRPLAPTTVVIGDGNHITAPKPLPKDIKDFLDSATSGAIYFSLGSTTQTKDLDKDTIDTILSTLGDLPYKVLWKFEADKSKEIPENVKILHWAPQIDILRHPNIKLFITQGGMQSLEEAVFFKVPMVALPVFADQKHNTLRMARKRILKVIPLDHRLEKERFKSDILEVINDPSYKQNIEKLSIVARDLPMSGMEKAIWWTEYVIRHRGTEHLKGDSIHIPFYQYYLLDVFGFVLAALLLALGLATLFLKVTWRTLKFVHRMFLTSSTVLSEGLEKKIS